MEKSQSQQPELVGFQKTEWFARVSLWMSVLLLLASFLDVKWSLGIPHLDWLLFPSWIITLMLLLSVYAKRLCIRDCDPRKLALVQEVIKESGLLRDILATLVVPVVAFFTADYFWGVGVGISSIIVLATIVWMAILVGWYSSLFQELELAECQQRPVSTLTRRLLKKERSLENSLLLEGLALTRNYEGSKDLQSRELLEAWLGFIKEEIDKDFFPRKQRGVLAVMMAHMDSLNFPEGAEAPNLLNQLIDKLT